MVHKLLKCSVTPLALKEVLGLLQAEELGKSERDMFFLKGRNAPLFHPNRKNNMYHPTCKYTHMFKYVQAINVFITIAILQM